MKHLLALFIAILFISSCGSVEPLPDGFVELIINEGSHRSRPYRLSVKDRTYLAYEWRFDESAMYELGDDDQCDWNKLTGLSLHNWTNHRNSVMTAWRYDRDGFIWISVYYHENDETFWASTSCSPINAETVDPELGAIRLDIGDVLETHINVNSDNDWTAITIINTASGETLYWEKDWDEDFNKTREIYPYYGGNEEAPQDISIYRRTIADE
jgi:hypothetical protein